MKVGDFIRSKATGHYGLILEVRHIGGQFDDVLVLWQGIACDTTWEFSEDLVFGVENELTSFRGQR